MRFATIFLRENVNPHIKNAVDMAATARGLTLRGSEVLPVFSRVCHVRYRQVWG